MVKKRRCTYIDRGRIVPLGQKANRGSVLILSMAILLVLMIGMPMAVRLLRYESIGVNNRYERVKGEQLADAGLSKAFSKIAASSQTFIAALSGVYPAGYANDVVFNDMPGGEYKILMASGPAVDQLTIVAKGRATDGDVQGIRAVFEKAKVTSAFSGGPVHETNNGDGLWIVSHGSLVHWGSITANYMTFNFNPILTGDPLVSYPRKKLYGAYYYNGGAIDASPASPNTNGLDWWTYESTAMQPVPQLDHDYYRAKAKNSVVPTSLGNGRLYAGYAGVAPAVADPPGSGYFSLDTNGGMRIDKTADPGYSFSSSTSVLYFDRILFYGTNNEVRIASGTFLDVEAVVSVYGVAMEFSGTGGGVFGATIPINAPQEYLSPGGILAWNAGAPSMATVYASLGPPARCCYPLDQVFVKGLLAGYSYVVGAGFLRVCGAYVGTWVPDLMNPKDSQLYADDHVVSNVRILNGPRRILWQRVSVAW